MPRYSQSPIPDLIASLERVVSGEVRFDLPARLLYSTDASIYQITPIGVVFPRHLDELSAIVEIAAEYNTPLLARGSGSSLAGQAVGHALVVDCSRHLKKIVEVNPDEGTATVQPGVIMTALNKAVASLGLKFGPDPASADRATMGGSIASNASGAHSIQFGLTVDHVLSIEAILADGSKTTFESIPIQDAYRIAGFRTYRDQGKDTLDLINLRTEGIESNLYRAALNIRDQFSETIRNRWPSTWRRASGYNLNYLLPWSPSAPPRWFGGNGAQRTFSNSENWSPYPPITKDTINLANLIVGSEGTLAIIRQAKVRLVPKPAKTVLGVLAYASLESACEAVPYLLDVGPSAIELIPRNLIRLTRSIPAYAHQVAFLDPISHSGDPAALLVVEFSGEDIRTLKEQVSNLGSEVLLAISQEDQERVWSVRKMGLGILQSRPGDPKAIPFIEDMTVPVERLGGFVREMERILSSYGTQGDFYGHASAGCLHMRPLLDLKTSNGIREMHAIAKEAVDLCIRLGGAVTGEHGDGLARSEWLERAYGEEIMSAFRKVKNAADPNGILNPNKMIDAPSMIENLRYEPEYEPSIWRSNLNFSREAGFDGAIELCNGAGVCRKSSGVMCPSFQATQDEMHSTRGRANLLRAMISGRFPTEESAEETVFEALDLCLACKGCKAECPSSVDMAKLKYEFLDHYYRGNTHSHHRHPIRDYLFAFIEKFAKYGQPMAPLANRLLDQRPIMMLAELALDVAHQRKFPQLSHVNLHDLILERNLTNVIVQRRGKHSVDVRTADCLFLSDPFTEYFQPEVGLAALEVLSYLGFIVEVLPVVGSGRTYLSKGFIDSARKQAIKLTTAIKRADPVGRLPVIGVEPSEIYTLRGEYLDLLPENEDVSKSGDRAWMIDEFLLRIDGEYKTKLLRIAKYPHDTQNGKIYLHGHCYQKTQPPSNDGLPIGVSATVKMLEAVGYPVSVIDSGCCGMAGAFGYEAEHYEVSMQIGELELFPAVRKAISQNTDVLIAAAGVSCKSQIQDGTGVVPIHPIVLVRDALGSI